MKISVASSLTLFTYLEVPYRAYFPEKFWCSCTLLTCTGVCKAGRPGSTLSTSLGSRTSCRLSPCCAGGWERPRPLLGWRPQACAAWQAQSWAWRHWGCAQWWHWWQPPYLSSCCRLFSQLMQLQFPLWVRQRLTLSRRLPWSTRSRAWGSGSSCSCRSWGGQIPCSSCAPAWIYGKLARNREISVKNWKIGKILGWEGGIWNLLVWRKKFIC